jgi:GNAT superfamily N-acetyltransferase
LTSAPATVRQARPEDSATILRLIRQLAAFEGGADGIALSEDVIRRDAFGEQPRFEVLLAEQAGAICGLVTVLTSYSSWNGAPTLVVHDLFIEEAARGSGAGRALLSAVAELACRRGCCRLDVNVVGWNDKARRFYECLGFTPLADWLPHRLDRDGLERLAATQPTFTTARP